MKTKPKQTLKFPRSWKKWRKLRTGEIIKRYDRFTYPNAFPLTHIAQYSINGRTPCKKHSTLTFYRRTA